MVLSLSSQIAAIAVASVAAQWTGWRLRIPAIVFLLTLGFLLGPVSGIIQPEKLLGDLFHPAISAAVAIILFEGSLHLRLPELKEAGRAVRRIIFLGAPLGWLLISLGAHFIAGLEWPVAITLGGILIVTGPTVIMPMLRHSRLHPKVASILKWEGIVNDPVGVILGILVYEYFVAASTDDGAGFAFFAAHAAILVLVGFAGFIAALLTTWIFERGYVPEYLKSPALLSAVLAVFFASDALLDESGLIAVTVMGMTIANTPMSNFAELKKFKENITLLLVSGVFILLTANLDMNVLLEMNWRGLTFVLTLLFIIRPAVFAICSIGAQMTRQEILLAGLIAPRGVVCAAMAGVIGPRLSEAGFAGGNQILPIAFAIVLLSVMLHSLMIRPLARRLNLTFGASGGLIIAGASSWSIDLATTLMTKSVEVIVTDTSWLALSRARLAGVPVYYGEILAEAYDYSVELNKFDTVLSGLSNPTHNALICDKFLHEYSRGHVYRLSPGESATASRNRFAHALQGQVWASETLTFDHFDTLYDQSWRFKATRIGKLPDGSLIQPEENETRIIVGVISRTNVLTLYPPEQALRSLVHEDETLLCFEKPAENTANS